MAYTRPHLGNGRLEGCRGGVCSRLHEPDVLSRRRNVGRSKAQTEKLVGLQNGSAPASSLSVVLANVPEVAVPSFPAPQAGHFITNQTAFTEGHMIKGHEAGPDQKATVVTIANILQEVAGNHAVGMWGRASVGFAALPNYPDLIFVMTRLQIRMKKYPVWGQLVEVETYFAEEGRLAARRDWTIRDGRTGEELGCATSTWVTINHVTRKLSKLPEDLRAKFMQFSPGTSRHALPVQDTRKKLPDFVYPAQIEAHTQMARRSDMDMNGHINNVIYLAWALETVPQDIHDSCQLYEIEVDFKAECQAGQAVEPLANRLPDVEVGAPHAATAAAFLHTLRRCDERECYELVRARTLWTRQT